MIMTVGANCAVCSESCPAPLTIRWRVSPSRAAAPVEPAPGRLRVQMAAHQNGRQRGILAGTGSEQVSDLIDGHGAPDLTAPRPEQVTSRLVLVGESLAIADTALRSADSRHRHDGSPRAARH